MTSQSGSGSPAGGTAATRGRKGGPVLRATEIDVAEARKAFFLMVGFIGLIWILQVANWADHYQLDFNYGVLPRSIGRLPEIFTAPFLHFSWNHIEGNSGPLFIFGFLAAYRGVVRFLGVTVLVAITSGMAVWLFQGNNQLTVGASGLIFGYFGYVLSRGIIDRNLIDALAAVGGEKAEDEQRPGIPLDVIPGEVQERCREDIREASYAARQDPVAAVQVIVVGPVGDLEYPDQRDEPDHQEERLPGLGHVDLGGPASGAPLVPLANGRSAGNRTGAGLTSHAHIV